MELPVLDTRVKWALGATLVVVFAVLLFGAAWPNYLIAFDQSPLLPFLLLYPAALVISAILLVAFLQTGSTRLLGLMVSFAFFFLARYDVSVACESFNCASWYYFLISISLFLLVLLGFVSDSRRIQPSSRGKYLVGAVAIILAAVAAAFVVLQILVPLLPPFADAAGINSDFHRILSLFTLLLSGVLVWRMLSLYFQRRSPVTLGLSCAFLLFSAALVARFLSVQVNDMWTEIGRFFILLFIVTSAISFLSVYFKGEVAEVYPLFKKQRAVRHRRLKHA